MVDDPRLLGLPHPTWRPSQKDAYEKALQIHKSGGGNVVIEAPCGVGKSGIPTALGHTEYVTVLVHNHGLLKQYQDVYNFDIIMGRPEYECVLPDKVSTWRRSYNLTPTAADCHFTDMFKCPYSDKCPYVIARERALASKRMACTYKYAALSEQVQDRPGILVCDEAHDFYEELLSIAAFQIDEDEVNNHKFPSLPLVGFGPEGNGDVLDGVNRKAVEAWFLASISKIAVVDLFNEMTPDGVRNKRMLERMTTGLKMVHSKKPIFYRCSKPEEAKDWRFNDHHKVKIKMEIRSLDVKDMVESLSSGKMTRVLMSATIGDPKPLMEQLGIETYKHLSYPHPTPPSQRPVYDLGVDKMTKANLDMHPGLYAYQAERIASFIKSLDPKWRGIVLTTSNFKINQLKRYLRQSLNGRIFEPYTYGLRAQIDEFMKDKTPGRLAVVTIQGWGSGISLVGDIARYAIVAGVPYVNPGDRFDQLRTSTPEGRAYAFWSAYCQVVQATGRVSRGELEEDGSYMLNVGAIADGSALTPIAKRSYSKWFTEAITKW